MGQLIKLEKPLPNRVPFFAVGYRGWKTISTVKQKLCEAKNQGSIVDGILVLDDPGIYCGREPDYSELSLEGPQALYGLLLSIEHLTSSMIAAKPPYKQYVW